MTSAESTSLPIQGHCRSITALHSSNILESTLIQKNRRHPGKPRVLLRVKSRRGLFSSERSPCASVLKVNPSSIASATCEETSCAHEDRTHTAKRSASAAIVPDVDARYAAAPEIIRLTLPPYHRFKRQKVSKILQEKKEELSLIRRLQSSVTLHGDHEIMENLNTLIDNETAHQTSSPRGHHLDTNLTCGSQSGEENVLVDDDESRIPPPSNSDIVLSSTNDLSFNTHIQEIDGISSLSQSKAPIKPKRSVIFRKMTELRKRLVEEIKVDAGDQTEQCQQQSQPEISQPNDLDCNNDRNSIEEEQSKWLRIVDVKLEEYDEDCDGDSTPHDKSTSVTMDTTKTGNGLRVRRMRPHPTDIDCEDYVKEDNTVDANFIGKGSSNRSFKRRKLGLVVERSHTILESDFWASVADVQALGGERNETHAACNLINVVDDHIDPEVVRLIEYSMVALHNQGGGAVSPHLSFLRTDSRVGFVCGTARGRLMINHKLCDSDVSSHVKFEGRTVLHYAADWGDMSGVLAALDMGADPTILDNLGYNPSDLARMNGHQNVLSVLLDEETRPAKRNEAHGDYYYEVYCLENENTAFEGANENKAGLGSSNNAPFRMQVPHRAGNNSPYASSLTTAESDVIDSPPDLMRSNALSLSEGEDSSGCSHFQNDINGCVLMELRKGFGYWNEQGELILQASDEQQSSTSLSLEENAFDPLFPHEKDGMEEDELTSEIMGDEEHDSNNEDYDGNDYPEDQSSEKDDDSEDEGRWDSQYNRREIHLLDFDCLLSHNDDCLDRDAQKNESDSDENSDGNHWKLDFRNRFVSKNASKDEEIDFKPRAEVDFYSDLSASHGLVSSNNYHMNAWRYSADMSDGESDNEYAGPMLGEMKESILDNPFEYSQHCKK